MTTLFRGGNVINVFTGEIEKTNVLIEGNRILGVGDYQEADRIIDISGKYLCPSFIDGHIHIESTMLQPRELAKVCIPHGTGAIISDPHEIANVCGTKGISYMLEASKSLPMMFYFMLPSCVPATPFDETGAALSAEDLEPFYGEDRVLGLAEVMNYPGVVYGDPEVHKKLERAKLHGGHIDGHAPLLSGRELDIYTANGIEDDHECTSFPEALEKLRKGQWIMIREGTSARNLEALLPLFDAPYFHRCLLVSDDKHPDHLLEYGHIDEIIRKAVTLGKSAVTGIRMATIQAAQCFGLKHIGAIAPGYMANLLVLNDLDTVDVEDVYYAGEPVCLRKELLPMAAPESSAVPPEIYHSVCMPSLCPENFIIQPEGTKCRVIQAIPGQILTNECIMELDFDHNNGIDAQKDIIKLAVCERHKNTGHIGLGYLSGLGIRKGAIASTVSHDSHNLIIVGANDADMALAGNTAMEMGGGMCVVCDGRVLAKMPLHIAGLMSNLDGHTVARENKNIREAVHELGVAQGVDPFMHLAFLSLSVIPSLKMTTFGLIDVNSQTLVSLFTE